MEAVLEVEDVAKKAAKAGRPPSERGPRDPVITVKAYPEWKEWFDRFRMFLNARGERVGDNAALLDLSLIELAKSRGFELPPER